MRVFVDVGPARCNNYKLGLCVCYLSNQQLLFLSCAEVNIVLSELIVSIVDLFLAITEEL